MKISVLVATYNGELYIEQQLKSILNQTRAADEVIIVDDVSTDSTVSICRNFIEANALKNSWKLHVRKKNVGFVTNFLDGIKYVTGDVFFLCDQDDIWESAKLAVMEEIFEKHPNTMAVTSNFNFIDKDGKDYSEFDERPLSKTKDKEACKKMPFRYYIGECAALGCCIAFSYKIAEYIDIDTYRMLVDRPSHDTYLMFLAYLCGEVYSTKQILTHYRVHSNNASHLIDRVEQPVQKISQRLKNRRDGIAFYRRKVASYLKLISSMTLDRSNMQENRTRMIREMERFLRFTDKRLTAFDKRIPKAVGIIELFFCMRKYREIRGGMLNALRFYLIDCLQVIRR